MTQVPLAKQYGVLGVHVVNWTCEPKELPLHTLGSRTSPDVLCGLNAFRFLCLANHHPRQTDQGRSGPRGDTTAATSRGAVTRAWCYGIGPGLHCVSAPKKNPARTDPRTNPNCRSSTYAHDNQQCSAAAQDVSQSAPKNTTSLDWAFAMCDA